MAEFKPVVREAAGVPDPDRLSPQDRRIVWRGLWALAALGAALLVPGVSLLVIHATGTPAQATVDDCETTGAGRYEATHCSGSWVVGGSLLDGGHVVLGSIDGADETDQGKTLDVVVHGDRAYTHSLTIPLVLAGIGACPVLVAIAIALRLRRPREGRIWPGFGG